MTSTENDTVTVHGFRTFQLHPELPNVALFKATLSHIRELGGEPIAGSQEVVRRADLDRQGHYRRIATGWGELN